MISTVGEHQQHDIENCQTTASGEFSWLMKRLQHFHLGTDVQFRNGPMMQYTKGRSTCSYSFALIILEQESKSIFLIQLNLNGFL